MCKLFDIYNVSFNSIGYSKLFLIFRECFWFVDRVHTVMKSHEKSWNLKIHFPGLEKSWILGKMAEVMEKSWNFIFLVQRFRAV